jgi:hypothetical protein
MSEEYQTVLLTVRLKVKPGVDIDTLVEELDYQFSDEENCIIETEIVGVRPGHHTQPMRWNRNDLPY